MAFPPSTDYTDRDFDSIKERLTILARSVFADWTDFNIANFGNILLEMKAFVGDVLSFYIDAQGRESRFATVVQRKNMIALAKLIAYKLPGAAAATAEATITLSQAAVANVTIPAGTIVKTKSVEPIFTQTLADLVIPTPILFGNVDVENSEAQQEVFSSTNLPNQLFELGFVPFLDGSLVINAGNGIFIEVDNFVNSAAADPHFTVTVDQNDRATVRFGNGSNGLVPTGTITIDYKTGGGSIGNVEANTLESIEGSFTDALSNPVAVTVTNAVKASGGIDRQTVDLARILAPESLRVINRTVAKEDYEINARSVPGVARALMVTSNEDPGVSENTGNLIIIPVGGGLPTSTLKDQVLAKVTIELPNTLTFLTIMTDPSFKTVSVDATVFLKEGANAATVKTAIETALASFFAISNPDGTPNTNVDFGINIRDASGGPALELAWSDVFNVVRDVPGIRKVDDDSFDLAGVPDDIALLPVEFPVLGTITLTNGDTTAPL